jgi:hypothetical protein
MNMVVGVLLFASAFLWPHTPAMRINAVLAGFACVAIEVAGLFYPVVRYANTALSVWLLASAIVLPHVSMACVWMAIFASVTMFIVSLMPTKPPSVPQGPAPPSSYVSGPGGDYTP